VKSEPGLSHVHLGGAPEIWFHSSAEYLFKHIMPAKRKLPLVVLNSEDQAAEFCRMNDRVMMNIVKAMKDPGGRVCRSLLKLSLITNIF
jgi:hypothetical protein